MVKEGTGVFLAVRLGRGLRRACGGSRIMGAVKQFYHDEICAMQDDYGYEPPKPNLHAEMEAAFKRWTDLIYELPAVERSQEQQARLDQARLASLAARDAYFDAVSREKGT